ncbi:hypothetical protein L6452_01945 [Arctium lappa]|uniref:Uncharacterized protein n=1 Tax=Arctium lappa TaxID=4217 RepID=A0ACB9FJC3_ARCLA|nr:hypothetical protein L6452_01945 [Arctium lappa]
MLSPLSKNFSCTTTKFSLLVYVRLVPGHALLSYGLHCALLSGVPQEVLRRATFVLDATTEGIQMDRDCSKKISAQDEQYK